jgi:hypothetical protein
MTGNALARHLVVVVAVKLAALAGLWWFFVRDADVRVDAPAAAARLAALPATPSIPGNAEGRR